LPGRRGDRHVRDPANHRPSRHLRSLSGRRPPCLELVGGHRGDREEGAILASSVTGGASSLEATRAAALGFSPIDVVTDTTWASLTAAQFADYQLIVIGDPTCPPLRRQPEYTASTP
jgi:hypothetical protein